MTAPLSPMALRILEYVPRDAPAARIAWIARATGQPRDVVQSILMELRSDGIVVGGRGGWWRRA